MPAYSDYTEHHKTGLPPDHVGTAFGTYCGHAECLIILEKTLQGVSTAPSRVWRDSNVSFLFMSYDSAVEEAMLLLTSKWQTQN